MPKEITIFAKRRVHEGKTFYNYITSMATKDGETRSLSVKFKEESASAPDPSKCPMNIVIEKKDVNIAERKYRREDTGDTAIAYTLWISAYKPGSKYVDHSTDDYEW